MDINTQLAGMASLDLFKPVATFTGEDGITVDDAELRAWHEEHDDSHFRREAMLVLSGKTLQKLSGKYFECVKGSLFLVNRNEHHGNRYDPGAYGLHVWLYILPESVICNIYSGEPEKLTAIRCCHYRAPQEIRELHNVWDRVKNKAPEDIAELIARLRLLYCSVSRQLMTPENLAARNDSMELLKQYLWENCGKDSSIDQLANLAGCSKQHLMRKFKEKFNCTIGEYINKIRWEKLRELQKNTTVKELAYQLGFDSSAAFCHWRKRSTPPTDSHIG